MDSETRRLIFAIVVATGVFLVFRTVVSRYFPPTPPPPPATQPASAPAAPGAVGQPAGALDSAPATAPTSGAAVAFMSADTDPGAIVLGGRDGDALRIELTTRGAAVNSIELFSRRSDGRFVHRQHLDTEAPYALIAPAPDSWTGPRSFETQRVWIQELDHRSFALDSIRWGLESASPDEAVFIAALRDGDAELLRVRKVYRLEAGKPLVDVELSLENPSSTAWTISYDQAGASGIAEEDPVRDMRKLLTAQVDAKGEQIVLNHALLRQALVDAAKKGETVRASAIEKGPIVWTALVSKYFGVFIRPIADAGVFADTVAIVNGTAADPGHIGPAGDLLAVMTTKALTLAPGARVVQRYEIYAGPKEASHIRQADPALVDPARVYYPLAASADMSCMCTFACIQDAMVWLLEAIFSIVRNYGVAIIVLVIIVRGLLHPLSVFQQRTMFKTQEGMARVQPKIEQIKQRYADDRVKLNQEMMRVFAEENVNPAASMIAFIPIMLQMPILVALWNGLSTDVHLRHAPFDGWWIRDLSAPDAFIHFSTPLDIPVLSAIPLIGWMFAGIKSINLLPVLMGVSMWLQQKYMPKPNVHAHKPPDAAAAPRKPGAMTPEEQLKQQQMMAYMMSIMFPLMFYSMPSGLNLYWLATNVFGIGESLLIRRQLEREKQRRAALGPATQTPKKPTLVSRWMKKMAEQAEELQRKADEISKNEPNPRGARSGGKKDA